MITFRKKSFKRMKQEKKHPALVFDFIKRGGGLSGRQTNYRRAPNYLYVYFFLKKFNLREKKFYGERLNESLGQSPVLLLKHK